MYMHSMHMMYATVRERDAIANDAMRRMHYARSTVNRFSNIQVLQNRSFRL